jgi:hypothetical protein
VNEIGIPTDAEIAARKIAELKVGDQITFGPPTPISLTKLLIGRIVAIYRDSEGDRIFDVGADRKLIPANALLLPDWFSPSGKSIGENPCPSVAEKSSV